MSLKRRLLKAVSANRENILLQKINSIAKNYHFAYENLNYDCNSNGELFLANKLNSMDSLSCVIDVGANIGDYSRIIRTICNKCRIFAIEPVPSTFKKLIENTESLNIETSNFALGNFSGKAEINSVPNASTLASLVEGMQEGGGRDCIKIAISVKKGEQFIKDNDIKHVSLLKIDTEGYESEVLKGFGDAIKKIDVVQFEYGKANLFTKYFIHDYYREYSKDFYIGKLYPNGVLFYEKYHWDLDDLIGPNYVMVSRKRPDIKLHIEC
jgi:FkbM family methyltransferase